MKDQNTDEDLTFECHRWLARDEDDSEIVRELPAVRKAEPILPGTVGLLRNLKNRKLWN